MQKENKEECIRCGAKVNKKSFKLFAIGEEIGQMCPMCAIKFFFEDCEGTRLISQKKKEKVIIGLWNSLSSIEKEAIKRYIFNLYKSRGLGGDRRRLLNLIKVVN